ncbi:MAG: hypothetical protein QGG42_02395 [Phycisphaerae bacterium]|jgi:hypothetical protein|nr:hypothetical protein [Phycisphaerae bacterium]
MKRFVLIALLVGISTPVLADSFAAQVIHYDAGAAPAGRWYGDDTWTEVETIPLTDPYHTAALGKPTGFVVEPYMTTPGAIVSTFSPAADPDQIVSIGEGGRLTLRLENYVAVRPGPDIGLFTNVALADSSYPNNDGVAGTPVFAFGIDTVKVDVSYDGSDWTYLGPITPNIPTNVWLDASNPFLTSTVGLTEADFSQPFTGTLSDFDGKTYAEIKTLLGGSAGGYWLDLSGSGLSEVGYIRFRMPDDGVINAFPPNFELDAVSIASGHVGAQLPEPCTMSLLALAGMSLLRRRRK